VLAVAHRTPASAPACRALADLGVAAFEADVQLIRGELVVSHFLPVVPGLHRDGWVLSRTARAEPLAAVLARVPAPARVLVDLKTETPAAAEAVAAVVAGTPDRWYASCKRWDLLPALAAAGVPTWRSVATRQALAAVLRAPADARPVTVRHSYLDRATVARLRAITPEVVAWTVNDVRRAAQLADLGITGLTSDDPRVHAYAAGLG
jgi:glycerophosphoryl diester phosphodiesterase